MNTHRTEITPAGETNNAATVRSHRVPVEPLDPDSETGRRVAAALTRLLLDIDERLAREAATRRHTA